MVVLEEEVKGLQKSLVTRSGAVPWHCIQQLLNYSGKGKCDELTDQLSD